MKTLKVPDSNITVKVIPTNEFLNKKKYIDNPRQRDISRHQKKQHVNGDYAPDQQIVHVAKFHNLLYVLDGHTRRDAWINGRLTKPIYLLMCLYEVDNYDDILNLYNHFDSRDALETTGEALSGSLKVAGFAPQSELMQSSITTAIKLAAELLGDVKDYTGIANSDLHKYIAKYLDALQQVDSLDIKFRGNEIRLGYPKRKYCAGIVAAMIVSFAKADNEEEKERVMDFWTQYKDLDQYSDQLIQKFYIEHLKEFRAGGSEQPKIAIRALNAVADF